MKNNIKSKNRLPVTVLSGFLGVGFGILFAFTMENSSKILAFNEQMK